VGGGDGFDVMPDLEDPSWVFSMSQGGSLQRLNYKTGERWYLKPPVTVLNEKFRFNWNSGIAQDPFDKRTIYYGSQYLHKSLNKGVSWETISPDLTTNNPEQQKQDSTGGLTLDITGAETYNTILAIDASSKEKGVIWVGTDDGNVQLTRDGGRTWTNFRGKIPGLPQGAWIPQVRASRYNAAEAFVVANDYRRGDFTPYIFRTTDYGKTWTRLVDDKKVRGYALTVLQDPVQPNLIFVGTEHGLWISFDNGASFEQWKNGYPSVSTYDLAIQEREADLAIATFGRSIWILDDIRPLREIAGNNGRRPAQKIDVFPAPDAYQVNYRAAPGYEWSVLGLWDAENRRRGAEVSYYIAPGMDTSKAARVDSVMVKIYNDRNEVIRNLKWRADTGFNRQYWGMEERGYRSPNSPKPRPGAPETPGLQVFPGTYKVVVNYGKLADSTMITIKHDPRLDKSDEAKLAQRKMLDRLRLSSDKLIQALDRITESEETLGKIATSLRGLEGKEYDSLRKATTIMQDSLKAFREFISGKTSDRQGITRSPDLTVLSVMQQAQQYITSKSVAPGTQEEALVKNAELMINRTLARVNDFYNTRWKDYRKHYENTRLSLFKDYPPIN
jgi:hypothetical protein